MKTCYLFAAVAACAVCSPAFADEAAGSLQPNGGGASLPARKAADSDSISTGVARARDRLDSATSTSSLKEGEIADIGARSFGEILRNIPGLRVEADGGEGNANIAIRGLPLAQSGSKFLQLQEDGLPVMEFGDITLASPDLFMRADLNLGSIEAIRGGSASTFASNSPGGVINLIDKTGETTGGAVQASTGLDYGLYRVDFDYGARLNDSWRFHIGGYYREGQGPRATGYADAYLGGQLKFNVTKEFDGGYIRLTAKLLDDRSPAYDQVPLAVSGTNANPQYSNIAGFEANKDTLYSRYITSNVVLGSNNQPVADNVHEGMHAKEKAIGLEAQFTVAGWIVTDKFRFSAMSGTNVQNYPVIALPAASAAYGFGGAGATLSYATGPNAGQPLAAGGNGLILPNVIQDTPLNNLNYVVNDLRASRVWTINGGELTVTGGLYKSNQTINESWLWGSVFMDVEGSGNSNLVNITAANGTPLTQNGVYGYGGYFFGGATDRLVDVNYGVTAPYGSFNYHIGRLAIGGSIRYDMDTVDGRVFSSGATEAYDMNGDGVISVPENLVSYLPLSAPSPVNYSVNYLSFSTGVNYRIAPSLSVFARYSKGGRENADRMLDTPAINPVSGALVDPAAAVDVVRQTELGTKFRKGGLTLNLTGFLATATDHNFLINNTYRAYGLEFEGGFRKGPFSITAGATLTHAEITADLYNPGDVGNTPHHQAKLIYQLTPQYEGSTFSIGANIVGTTGSYADDSDQLRMSGYTVVSPFVQYRPVPRVTVSLNCNNLFNVIGLTEVEQASLPASGIVTGRLINGRTVSSAVRVNF